MQDIHLLDNQTLTQTLVMLSRQLSQKVKGSLTIHSISVSGMKILYNNVVMPIISRIKLTKSTKHMALLFLKICNKEQLLFVVSHLIEY